MGQSMGPDGAMEKGRREEEKREREKESWLYHEETKGRRVAGRELNLHSASRRSISRAKRQSRARRVEKGG